MTDIPLPRGIRNSNPGNLRYESSIHWLGQIGDDNGYAVFASNAGFSSNPTIPEAFYGIRALTRNLLTYFRMYGLHTIEQIITRWAPSSENDTEAYVADVCEVTHFDADQNLSADEPTLTRLVKAIIVHENGWNPYPDDHITAAVRAAFNSTRGA